MNIVFLDLDGTVIGSNGVSERTWSACEALRPTHHLVVCTGRTGSGVALEIAKRLAPEGVHIFENGGFICRATGDVLFESALDPQDIETMISHAEGVDATLEFYTAAGVFSNRQHPDCDEHARVLEIEVLAADLREVARNHRVIRAHWIMRPEGVDAALDFELQNSERGVASSPVLPLNVFASVTAKGVSKGSAAKWVAENLNVPLEKTWAVGDAESDRPVLEVVAHPRVMGDSPASLLRDFERLGMVDDNGLAAFLETLMPQ